MANSISSIAIAFGIDAKAFDRGLKDINNKLGGLKSIVGTISAAFAGVGVAGFFGWGIKLAAEAETAQTAFEVLLGSTEKAKKLLAELRELDIKTPFDIGQLRDASRVMLAFGVDGEKVTSTLARIADIAGTDAEKLRALALAFSQTSAAGRLTGQDLLQFVNAGFNPLQEISRLTGRSLVELKKLMEDGAISAKLVELAIVSATSEGGRFFQLSDKQSQTMQGRWNKLVGEIKLLATEIGESLVPAARWFIDTAKSTVEWLRSWEASQLKLSATIIAFTAGSTIMVRVISAIPAVIGLITKSINAMTVAMVTNMAVANGWIGAAKAFGVVLGGLLAAGLIKSQFDEIEKAIEAGADAAKKLGEEAGKLDGKLPDGTLKIKKEMEALLGLTPGSAAALNNFAKEARALRPAALLKGTSEAQSAINSRMKLNISPPQKEVVNKLGVLHMDLQNIAGILRGQRPQQVLPANI